MRPIRLTTVDVLALHNFQLRRYGGLGGIRDEGVLESAVTDPEAGFRVEYLHEDLAEMASAYLISIVRTLPFIDRNKRTGLASALKFLDLNGIAVDHSSKLLYDAIIAVEEGWLGKVLLAGVLRGLATTTE